MLAHAQKQRPNIIYIMTDQHSQKAMSCAGNAEVKTPHIDRLAQRGIRMDNAYCALPLSGPSRAAMFTGYTPSEIGMEENGSPMPDSIRNRTLGTLMAEAGYDCAYAGKWHLNTNDLPDSVAFGFRNLHGHNDHGLAEDAVNWLRNRTGDKPFFLVASFDNPHNICEYARHQNTPYATLTEPAIDDCPRLPKNFAIQPYDAGAIQFEKRQNQRLYPSWDYSPDDWRRYLNAYYRLIETVEKEIGKIIDEIDRQQLWRNTIVIFTADHGDGMGAHQWNQKTVLYEETTNIPFIVCLPKGRNAGKQLPQLVNNGVDLMPSLCEWAGITIPKWCQGVSLKRLLEQGDPSAQHQPYIVTETKFAETAGTLGWMVRTKDYKYVLYDNGRNREQLFDIQHDRGEMQNLAIEGKYKDVVRYHRQLLLEWMERHPSKATKYKEKYIPKD